MIVKDNIKDIYELTPLQKGMLFHHLENPNSHSYFEQMTLTFNGEVDVMCLEQALNNLIQKYDILRTSFVYNSFKTPVQIVLKERKTRIHYEDITSLSEIMKNEYLENYIKQDRELNFNLATDILIRFSLFKTDKSTYKLIWSHHHIILDGWCLDIILNDLFDFYMAIKDDKEVEIGSAIPYSTYVKWQQKQNKSLSQEYWDKYVKDYDGCIGIPTQTINLSKEYTLGTAVFQIGEKLTEGLFKIAKDNQVTFSTAFQTIWGVLLQKYNSTNDVCFGTVVSGRTPEIPHVDQIVGLFINTIPVRIKGEQESNISTMMKCLQKSSIESEQHAHLSLSDISSNAKNNSSIINHVLIIENYPIDLGSINKKISFEIKDIDAFEQTNYDFDLTVYPGSDLRLVCSYNKNVYDSAFINRIEGHLKEIIKQLVEKPDIKVSDISLVTEEERNILLNDFNQTAKEYSRNKTIQELFELQVNRYHDSRALVFDGMEMTYRELNEKVNQSARYLRAIGVGKNEFVGIMIDRSLDMVVNILAVIKAGAAYLPIEKDYPKDRIDFILRDSKAKYIITDSELKKFDFEGQIIKIDNPLIHNESIENLENINESDDIAYMIYTSGSTGKPKGVIVEHRNVNSLSVIADSYLIKHGERVLQTASISFDASVAEIFCTLLNGATLYLVRKDFMLSGQPFMKYLQEEKISSIQFVPSLLKVLPYTELPDLKLISTGGEALSKDLVQKWGKGRRYLNAYGPTETTVDATHAIYEDGKIDKVHIGKPIYNKKVYILDADFNLLPIGIAGELFIGGEGVAKGYWERPELTATAFIDNPFIPGEKIYRTGDLARFLEDGNLEYIGRNDYQYKVRGYRIELTEIEENLRSHPLIKDAVVVVREEEINAYFVTEKEGLNLKELQEYLKQLLPDYMLPNTYDELEQLPLSANGKVNKELLPIPKKPKTKGEKIALNSTEEKLLEIWEEILGKNGINYTDNFYSLGGHSLKAMMLLSSIQKVFQVDLTIRDILENNTIRKLSQCIKNSKRYSYQAISPVTKSEYYPVSSVQKRMYALQQFQGVGTSYNIPVIVDFYGELDVATLQKSIKQIVERHEALRTSFHMVDGQIMQKVHDNVNTEVEFYESNIEDENSEIHNFMRPFDLSKAPLFRAKIIKINEQKYVLLLDMNHIIADGLSIEIIITELTQLYRGAALSDLTIQYKDYATWQNQQLQTKEMKKQEEYWLQKFDGSLPVLELPLDYSRPLIRQYEGKVHALELNEDLIIKLKDFTEKHNISTYALLLSIYNVLLSKYSNEEDIIIGITTSGRSHHDIESVVGMFAQTLALRNYNDGTKPFLDFIFEVKQSIFEALEHTDYPLEELLNKLQIKRDISRNPLFDTMFVLENSSLKKNRFNKLDYKMRNMEWTNAKLDLTWYVQEQDEGTKILIEYSSCLFREETIQRMGIHFINLLNAFLENPEQKLNEVGLISEKEKDVILKKFNNTKVVYPPFKPLHVIFEEQVSRTPDDVALIFGEEKMTYRELNNRVNQVTRILRSNGVGKNVVVGILMDRSFEMIIGILSILKAGGAYMPIATNFPKDRTEYMIENSGVKLVLTQRNFANIIEAMVDNYICLDEEEIYIGDTSNINNINEENDLAYIIYTSGSTGKPKGVMIEHFTVINRIGWMVEEYKISAEDTFIQKTPYVFDVSVWEIFMWFFKGSKLYLLQQGDERFPDRMIEGIEKFNVTSIHFVPSMLNGFLDFVEIPQYFNQIKSLKRIFTSGEALLPNQVERFNLLSHQAGLYNLYGPTEATIDVTYFNCLKDEKVDVVPIGKPIDNVELYIIDANNHLQPVGVPGELCISGICLARGYINREDLTNEKFVNNPFANNQKMYKTGDLARWLPDGNIEFLGRIDNQVKIRGYRIELDEITGKLLEYKAIKEGVVIAREDSTGSHYLCAYFVAEENLDIQDIKLFLGRFLPEYMVPTQYIQIDNLPLTHNGKLDRKSLPEPVYNAEKALVLPGDEKEAMLAMIWRDVLKIDEVGVTDNFFEVGGDSIKAINVVAQLSRQNIKVGMTEFFKNPTIRGILPYLKEKKETAYQGIVTGNDCLTPIQKWFFEQKIENRNHWNQSVLLYDEKGWDSSLLNEVFNKIVEHHDALRIIFRTNDTDFYQHNRPHIEGIYGIDNFNIDPSEDIEKNLIKIGNKLNKSLDIENGPLIRVGHVKTCQGEYVLIVIHHLLIDGVSWRILLEDFSYLYHQLETNNIVNLPEKTTSYLSWSEQLNEFSNSDLLLNEIPYWKKIDKAEFASLMESNTMEEPIKQESCEVNVLLDKSLTKRLLTNIHKAYHTEINDILLSALTLAVREKSGHSQIVLNLEGHGREEIIEGIDLTRTIGWFTTIYPVFFNLADLSLDKTIKTVKETLRNVPSKGIGYGILKYLSNNAFSIKPEILFNYLGQFEQDKDGKVEIANLSAGQEYSNYVEKPYILEINGMVIDDKMSFTFSYDSNKITKQTVLEIKEFFLKYLINIVEHCEGIKESEMTPSDFTIDELSIDELDDIFELLK